MKKIVLFIYILAILHSLFSDETSEKINPFEINIYQDIDDFHSFFSTDKGLEVKRESPGKNSYADRYGATEVIIAQNEKIKITYWNIDSKINIRHVVLKEKNMISDMSKYIGNTKENILETFADPYIINKEKISFSSGLDYLSFKLKDGLVCEIVFGKEL